MHLTVGDTYTVVDSKEVYTAFFMGIAVDQNKSADGFIDRPTVLVLEMTGRRKPWTIVGCELRCAVEQDGEVIPYLFVTHCGNTVEELYTISGIRRREPNWELM